MSFASYAAAWPRSRFAGLPPWFAGLVLAAVTALVLYGFVPASRSTAAVQPDIAANANDSDLVLYKAIIDRVAGGEPYYAAAAAEQRARHYPLHPFVTMRLPSLATIHAKLGLVGAAVLLWGLIAAAWIALTRVLCAEMGVDRYSLAMCVPVAAALSPAFAMQSLFMHETWAVILMTLSLMVRSRKHWVASVLLGFAAVSLRELALPFLCVMALAAIIDGTRREAAAWVAAIVAFGLLLAAHAHLVSTVALPSDEVSPGWGGFGGWRFVLTLAHSFTALAVVPSFMVAILVPLALLGLVGWRSPRGLRAALVLGGYMCAFSIVGRPDNEYWGLMLFPWLPIGLVFAPGAIRDLATSLRDGLVRDQKNLVSPSC